MQQIMKVSPGPVPRIPVLCLVHFLHWHELRTLIPACILELWQVSGDCAQGQFDAQHLAYFLLLIVDFFNLF